MMIGFEGEIDLATIPTCILSDGKAGHLNQSLGVAQALGIKDLKIIELKKPKFAWLLGWLHPKLAMTPLPRPPFPRLIISTGSLPARCAMYIKQQQPDAFIVQMMRPPVPAFYFDVLALPVHDRLLAHQSIVRTVGAPNKVTPELLFDAKAQWQKTFNKFKGNKIGVLLGGNSKKYTFTMTKAQKLGQQLLKLQEEGHSLLITPSRRTPKAVVDHLKNALSPENMYFWDGQGENPYLGILAWSDKVVTTVDSVSMASEAATAGKPVWVFDFEASKKMGKIGRFFKALQRNASVKPMGVEHQSYDVLPLADAQKVAGFVRAQFWRRHVK